VLAGAPLALAGLDEFPPLEEPEETGATFADNARLKALYYARALDRCCLADDSGLEVDAIRGEPGVRSARYAAADCPAGSPRAVLDAANNAKLLKALSAAGPENRAARFVCYVVLADPEGVLLEACDTVEGRIGCEPRGANGFGYDPLFLIPELGCSVAELDSRRKNELSHRGKALRRLAELLKQVTAR